MKIQIELVEDIDEEEVIIRCNAFSEKVQKIQRALSDLALKREQLIFYKKDTEYYLPLENILFFETGDSGVIAHTIDNMFQTKHKLYELEELLPGYFMRISKSAILNTNRIYSISRNLTAASVVEFQNTHKQVYVSRNYYKPLKAKLDEKRINH